MADLKLSLQLSVENGQFKVALTDAQGQVQKLGATSVAAGQQVERGFGQARRGVESISQQLAAAKTQLIAFFGARELVQFGVGLIRLADQYQSGAARLKLFTASQQEFNVAQKATFEIAQRTRTGLQDTIVLYGKLAESVRALGGNQTQALTITESVNQALQISGSSGAAASSAITQFGQALAGGVLRAEEFNSVIEAAPRLAQALADGLDVPRGALRGLVTEGKVTADQIVKALLNQRQVLEKEFTSLPLTVSASLTQVRNAFEQIVGQGLGGATGQLAQGIALVARNLGAVVEAVLQLGQVFVAVLLGRVAGAIAATVAGLARQVIATRAASAAAAEMGLAFAGASTAAAAFSGVLRLLGGPIGLIITGLTGLYFWLTRAKSGAQDAAQGIERSVDDILSDYERLDGVASKAASEDLARLQKEAANIAQVIAGLKKNLLDALAANDGAAARAFGDAIAAQEARLARLTRAAKNLTAAGNPLDAPLTVPGTATSPEAAKKAAEEAQKLREKEFKAFLEDLDARADAFDQAEQLKREISADTLEAQGRDADAALARLEAQYNEHLETLADDAEGIDLATKLFNAAKARLASDQIKAQAEKLIAELRDRISFRDQRSEFAEPSERQRLQAENAADILRTQSQLDSLASGGNAEGLKTFFDNARNSLAGFADEIARATEGPIAKMFRDWGEGTRAMESAAASWIDSTVNGITELVTGGKANFRDLADSIIKDIIRIQIRAAIAGLIGSIFPAAGQAPSGGVPSNFTGGDFGSGAGLSAASRSFAASFSPASLGFSSGVSTAGKYAAAQAQPAPTQVVNQIVNNTGAQVRAEPSTGPGGVQVNKIIINEVAGDIAAGGPVAKALGAYYGLQRRPSSARG